MPATHTHKIVALTYLAYSEFRLNNTKRINEPDIKQKTLSYIINNLGFFIVFLNSMNNVVELGEEKYTIFLLL